MKISFFVGAALCPLIALSGCASSGVKNPRGVPVTEMRADERGFVAGTGVESQDLVAVTDKMARSILSVPEIANARGVPRVVLEPGQDAARTRTRTHHQRNRRREERSRRAPDRRSAPS